MNLRTLKAALVILPLVFSAGALGDDIDLFVGTPAGASDLPSVLIVVDNTANWNNAFTNEMSALRNTLQNLAVNADGSAKFNIGLMLFSETSTSDSGFGGGYVRAAMRPMNSTNKALYAQVINSLDKLADKSNGGAAALTMAEAYRYFSGGVPYSGNYKAKADYVGNTTADWSGSATTTANRLAMKAVYALPGNALASKSADRYTWAPGLQCGRNYIIYISNGPAQDNTSNTAQANSMLSQAGGSTTQIPLSPTGSQSNPSDEWARFMKESSLGVTTYTIDVDPGTSGQGPGWTRLLQSMAVVGGGIQNYLAVTSGNGGANIAAAVTKALVEIQAVNSVFASVTLPVSANTQSTYANQVFIGMFRPDGGARPLWNGNFKQYRLGYVSGVLRLLDADGIAALNTGTGFITECARSFWTPTVADTYWAFRPSGECQGSDASNSPDGNTVEKGAQGYMLRASSVASRNLKTCSSATCSTLSAFDDANTYVTAASLGPTVTSAQRTTLINWARGTDLKDENNDSTVTGMRPSVHGDVVHSRAVAIDIGTAAAPKVAVFYGGNDGILRAVNGNQTQAIGSYAPGSEMWAFMPPEFFGSIQRLYDNTQLVSFRGIGVAGSAPKPYGMDGAITVIRGTTSTAIYTTMRRGGRALYAFDMPHSNPDNITLKWKRGCPTNFTAPGVVADTGCTSGLDGIGQTWSSAKQVKSSGYATPMLVMGGGYDTCEDSDPSTCTSTTKGNKVYVLDAGTGTVLKTLSTDRSVIADVTIVPDSVTGLAKYGYTADLGGNVYRLNIGNAAPSAWTITKIASLGCSTTASCSPNRKFMFAPDVLESGSDTIILLGSGDREKPLLSYAGAAAVSNYFFMLLDRPTDSTYLATESGNCSAAVLCLNSLLGITTAADPVPAALAAKKGWYLGLRATEQVVTSPITIFGTVTFSTHTPDVPVAGMCTSRLGTARVYNISYLSAASENGTPDRSKQLPGDTGLPPSPVAGMVDLGGDKPVAFCIGCDSSSSIEASEPPIPASAMPNQPKSRVFWYIQK